MRKIKTGVLNKILKIMEDGAKGAPVFALESKTSKNPFCILVATMLSTRTKDEKTAPAAAKLLSIAKTPSQLAGLPAKRIEKAIYGVGFYRMKAKNLKKAAAMISEKFGGKVPQTLEELMQLPGVGRKVGNIVLARAYGKIALGVDTHVHRISNRLGLVKTKTPHETEKELMKIVPKRHIRNLNKIFVAYGQTICVPVSPFCSKCKIRKHCKRAGVKKSR